MIPMVGPNLIVASRTESLEDMRNRVVTLRGIAFMECS
jgi:hypothetical protein